jgi:hypothetical protein
VVAGDYCLFNRARLTWFTSDEPQCSHDDATDDVCGCDDGMYCFETERCIGHSNGGEDANTMCEAQVTEHNYKWEYCNWNDGNIPEAQRCNCYGVFCHAGQYCSS